MKTYTGKNVEDALKQAAQDKQVTIKELSYKVLEESKGFLGIGSKAVIRAYCRKDICLFIKEYLDKFFTGIDLQVDVKVQEQNDFYTVLLNSDNNALLIGKNGQTLQSINEVVQLATSGEFKCRVRTLTDVNGYKEEKYQKVCALAMRVAKTVQRSKTDALLDPMPADERKAIHNCLMKVKGVSTVSEGEGHQRRLKIVYNPDKK